MSSAPQIRGERVLRRARKLLSEYDADSLRAMLHAACTSPTARQAKATCTALLLSCWQAPPSGSKCATADDLPLLVRKLRSAAPELESVEDFLPLDPRLVVCFRARREERGWRFRLHPGSLESPLDLLQQLANYADALDPAMQTQVGFGIGDMLDVAGAMLSHELALLAPAWSDASVAIDSQPFVTQAEVDAAAGYLRDWPAGTVLSGGLSAAGHLPQQDRAAQALTVPAGTLSFAPGPFSPTLGPAVIVDSPAGKFPVPAGVILEGLDCAVARAVAASSSPGSHSGADWHPGRSPLTGNAQQAGSGQEPEDRWRARSWSDFEVICRGLPANVLHGTTESGHDMVVIATGHRHVLAVELVAAIAAQDVARQVAAARERLAEFGPGSLFCVSGVADPALCQLPEDDQLGPENPGTGDGLTWPEGFADALPFPASLFNGEPAPLAPGTDVTRLIVVDGAWQPGQLWSGGIPACSMDEFRALLTEHPVESTDREELWAFLDELTSLGATSDSGESDVQLWFYSVLDAWAVWQERGVLHPAWLPQPIIGRITPRDIEPAWEWAARLDPVDELLADRDLPGIQSWTTAVQTPVPPIDPARGRYGWVTRWWPS